MRRGDYHAQARSFVSLYGLGAVVADSDHPFNEVNASFEGAISNQLPSALQIQDFPQSMVSHPCIEFGGPNTIRRRWLANGNHCVVG